MSAGFRVDFALFDEDGDGVISEEEGVRALRACGLCMAKSDLVTCLDEISKHRECDTDEGKSQAIMYEAQISIA